MKKGEVTYCAFTIVCPYCNDEQELEFDINRINRIQQKPNDITCDFDECQKEFLWEWPF